MDLISAIYSRHVVRHYDEKPLTDLHKKELNKLIKKLNKQYNMHMQLMVNEPKAFAGEKAKISNITGCVNYLVIAGPKTWDLQKKSGYVGEMVVLAAQQMGIDSCWVALTYDKQMNLYKIDEDESLCLVVALGYGTTSGKPHKSKPFKNVCVNRGKIPEWFKQGVKMALLAPTGKNEQGFMFELLPNNEVKLTNNSFCKDVDLGIIMYHFEIGAGKTKFKWVK